MKIKRFILLILVILVGLVSCSNGEDALPKEEFIIKDEKLMAEKINDNNRVFYEIFTGAFSDSNGDGIGDLKGIINKLDYLNDGNLNSGKSLGIGGIWLTPIFKSASYHKYDIDDYKQIDQSFGTMDDLKTLISECHKRDIKLILDLPLNHTSLNHDLFKKFRKAQENCDNYDPYYDYYCYSLKDVAKPSGRTFHGFNGDNSNWFYEGNFSNQMPELNFDKKEVRDFALDIAKFYLDMGIDGFRFDAAKYIYFGETDKNCEFWKWYVSELKKIKPDVYTVGEVWSHENEILDYYKAGLDCFNFPMSQSEGLIANGARDTNIDRYVHYVAMHYETIKGLNPDALMHAFISNHDMDRAAGYLRIATKDAFMAANLYLLTPGSPFIYYGEEIGMKGTRGASQTDANRRLAMLWGDGNTIKDPIGSTYDVKKQINGTVATHLPLENSLYNHYKKVIMARNANPEIARGTFKAISTDKEEIAGFISNYNNVNVLVMHNTLDKDFSIDLTKLTNLEFKEIRAALGNSDVKLEGNILLIPSQTTVILK